MTHPPQPQGPTPQDIVTALERTGYLLEQRGAQKLRTAGFGVIVNDAFPDPDKGESREIDIVGFVERPLDETDLTVWATVLIECKNYSNPLVLVGSDREQWEIIDESVRLSFDPLRLNFSRQQSRSLIFELDLWRLPGYKEKESFVGYQLVKMDRRNRGWSADNSSIYDGILYPLVKARHYQMELDSEHGGNYDEWELPILHYYFPVILTAGDVYTVAVTDDSSGPSVRQEKWATLRRNFRSVRLNTTLRADIVSFQHFDEYLQTRVLATVTAARDVLAQNTCFYDPEWLLEEYGEPDNKEMFRSWLNLHQTMKRL